MNIKCLFTLLFNKDKFHSMELLHVEELNKKQTISDNKDFNEKALDRINEKRKKLLKRLIWVIFLVSMGYLIAQYINNMSPLTSFSVRVLRGVSIVLIAWSVFGRLQDIETMKGETLLELTNDYVFKWFYSIGIFLASISLYLVSI